MEDIIFIELNGWWLLSVPFLLMFSLFVIALIIQKSSNELVKLGRKENPLTNWITKKDILYWLLMVCLGAISLFTYQYRGSDEVIGHWGFAGTIVSIILAVIAIGFTLFQTLSSDLSSAKIAASADIIVSASNEIDSSELRKSSEIIRKAASEIIEYHTTFETKLNGINNDIADLKNDQKENFDKVIAGFYSSIESTNFGDDRKNEEIIMTCETFAVKIYPKLPNYFKVFSYFVFYSNFEKFDSVKESRFMNEFSILLNKSIEDESLSRGTVMGGVFTMNHMLGKTGTLKDFKESAKKLEFLDRLRALITDDEIRDYMLKALEEPEEPEEPEE